MNRLVIRASAFCLALTVALSPCAFGKDKFKKKKKNVDLSANPLANVKSQQPDKLLYDKAMLAMKKGKYDIARLDLQTLLNTYSDSEYAMRAKLAVGDSWFKEGGTAALAQAESEYKDFITFFPNSPEAAEAQEKVGNIYFEQMEKPDRDPQNAENAEREYRTMLEQFPDSPLVPQAKQKLREVQEVLAQRQFEIGEYYASRMNWAGSIARLQTVADTYPLFSHSDETLITIGDAYATEAQVLGHAKNMPPAARAELSKYYDGRAAAAWSRVVTRYPLAAHVEDAKDRLIAMGVPVPTPSAEQLAESQAEEDSRVNVKLGARTLQLLGRGPNTVKAARVGEPSEVSPPPMLAPDVVKQSAAVLRAAVDGKPIPTAPVPGEPEPVNAAIANGTAPPTSEQPAKPSLESIPDNADSGNNIGVEVTSGAEQPAGSGSAPAEAAPSGSAPPRSGEAPLVAPVGPANNQPLPAIDKPEAAPQQVNEVPAGNSQAQVNTGANASGKPGKKKKPGYDKKDESSSKHKKKAGLDKLNPF
ncbi:MAG TPA: outer membrane protein assembly factor BamD [Acidobacteriaceae bacterium]|jgi:outer membrane protein assembly factor BamD|nr:outer membrane protein assembly factor BamD [Acidobacteriaceae bacterium]